MSAFVIGVALLLLVPVLLLAVPAIIAARRTDAEHHALSTHGVLAEAEILGYELCDEGRLLRYRYPVPGRATQFESSSLVSHRHKHLTVGVKVHVRYKASAPGVHILVPEDQANAAS